MTHSYDKIYLSSIQKEIGLAFDYAINDLNFQAEVFYSLFLASSYSKGIESGDPSILGGQSGEELVKNIILETKHEKIEAPCSFKMDKSPEYWAGWALTYFQWATSLSFSWINEFISLEEIINLYSPYHEMDIQQFIDKLMSLIKERRKGTNLKVRREKANLSQKELAELSSVPIRTIQQYEQKQKDINKAQANYLLCLSKVLSCSIEELMEKTDIYEENLLAEQLSEAKEATSSTVLLRLLDDYRMSIPELAAKAGTDEKNISGIIKNKLPISASLARKFARIFHNSEINGFIRKAKDSK